jgi:hypothetical protein
MTAEKNSGKGTGMKHAFIPAAIVLLGLAACADDDASHTSLYCPTVSRVAQLSSLTSFVPASHDVTAQITQAQITGIAGECDLEPKKHAVLVSFKIGFAATNGPADHGAPVELPYFVSVTQGETVVSKVLYTIPVTFDGNVTSATAVSKTAKVELPNVKLSEQTEILVGFQLSRDQLAYATDHPGS